MWRVAAVYSAAAFVVWQVADIAAPALGLPEWVMSVVVWATFGGLPLALVLAWKFDLTPEGVQRTPGGRVESAAPPTLPIPDGPLVGRTRELQVLLGLLVDPGVRLVSIVGPGGAGKTRLALEVLGAETARKSQFVPLDDTGADGDAVTGEHRILARIAAALRLSAPLPTPHAIAVALEGELLVLDGLPSSVAAPLLVRKLLEASPAIAILTTSRARLGLRAEHVVTLGGLDTASENAEGVQLFTTAARRLDPDFDPNLDDRRKLAAICTAVGGLPLAIELVSGWIDARSLTAILEEVRRGSHLNLEAVHVDSPRRHRSLAAVAEATLERLPRRTRDVATAVAVFRSPFTEAAAREVAGASLEALSSLLATALLHRSRDDRFFMHRVLSEHARSEWTEQEGRNLRGAHTRYFLARATALKAAAASDPIGAAKSFAAEADDMEAAWERIVRDGSWTEVDRSLDAFVALAEQSSRSVFSELSLTMAAELAAVAAGVSPALRGRIFLRRGRVRQRLGRLAEAAEDLVAGLAIVSKLPPDALSPQELGTERGTAFNAMGHVMGALGRYEDSERFCSAALAEFRAVEDRGGVAVSLMNLGVLAQSRSCFEEARVCHMQALELARQVGDRGTVADALVNLGGIAQDLGQLAEAAELFRRALGIARTIGDRGGVAAALANLGRIAYRTGNLIVARQRCHEAAESFRRLGDEIGLIAATINLADVELAAGDAAGAEALFLDGLRQAARKGAKPLVGEAVIGLAQIAWGHGRNAEAADLLLPTMACRELDPEAVARRDRLAAELGVRRDRVPEGGVRDLGEVALALIGSAKEEKHGENPAMQAHRPGQEL